MGEEYCLDEKLVMLDTLFLDDLRATLMSLPPPEVLTVRIPTEAEASASAPPKGRLDDPTIFLDEQRKPGDPLRKVHCALEYSL